MVDEPIVLSRAESPYSARTSYWGANSDSELGRAAEPGDRRTRFDRPELKRILSTYGRMVIAGEWRDTPINFPKKRGFFSPPPPAEKKPPSTKKTPPQEGPPRPNIPPGAGGGHRPQRGHHLPSVLPPLQTQPLKNGARKKKNKNEVVGADGAAEIGPAAGAPVIDEAGVPHQRFESLGFAQGSGGWAPNRLIGPKFPSLAAFSGYSSMRSGAPIYA